MFMSVQLLVNGQVQKAENASASEPLLWILREDLGLVGTKFGCGQASCGACTVLVDGLARRSCVTSCEAVASKAVTTIEGLAVGQALHPVQQAWKTLQVAQCGYCQAGQMMSAVALLKVNAQPSAEEIDAAMSGNLCRCGSYPRIRAAIHLAASLLKGGKA
jgi:isoquinoline 1-oxidoreductase subunit alpha